MGEITDKIRGEAILTRIEKVFPQEFYTREGKIIKLVFGKLEIDNRLEQWRIEDFHLRHIETKVAMEYKCTLVTEEFHKYEIRKTIPTQEIW